MKLIIVESPTKARKIQDILGKDFTVIASIGHVCDLDVRNMGIDIKNNFKTHYVMSPDKKEVIQEMIDKGEKADEILLFSDADREGEAISHHIKRYLSSLNKPIKRGRLHEITPKGIKEALQNLGDIDQNVVDSQEARRILDRIVGFTVSPYLINTVSPNLSAGRVQSVALRMIVDREQEITIFKPDEYWNLSTQFQTDKHESFTAKYDGKIKNETQVNSIIDQIKTNNDFYVASVKAQDKKEKPPSPLTTAKLQQYMAKKGFDADKTMRIAQMLYENGCCTYIRTDSVIASDEAVSEVRDWIKNAKYDVPVRKQTYANSSSAQDAHECVRPTDVSVIPDKLFFGPDEKQVYKIIWQFFVASQMENAIFSTLTVKISSRANSKLSFKLSGKALKYKGFLEIFGATETSKIDLPILIKDQELTLQSDKIKKEQKFSQPPPRYNKASILKELEDRGIGRPSTFAAIVSKIADKKYVELDGNIYRPTELGKKITNILIKHFDFMQYDYTKNMELLLDSIEQGKTNYLDMLKDFYAPFKVSVNKAYSDNGNEICEKCGSGMILRKGQNGDFYGCVSFPNCRQIKNIYENKNLSSVSIP